MSRLNKTQLIKEAEAQSKALKTIKQWLMYAIAASTVGAALTYTGFAGIWHTAVGVIGIILTFLSVSAAFIINLGMHRGRKNIERILTAAQNM